MHVCVLQAFSARGQFFKGAQDLKPLHVSRSFYKKLDIKVSSQTGLTWYESMLHKLFLQKKTQENLWEADTSLYGGTLATH